MEYDNLGGYVRQLFYLLEDNVFVNEFGIVVFNIFDYITPNELMLFKATKEYTQIPSRNGFMIELLCQELNFDY
jgi:hypothetical protein